MNAEIVHMDDWTIYKMHDLRNVGEVIVTHCHPYSKLVVQVDTMKLICHYCYIEVPKDVDSAITLMGFDRTPLYMEAKQMIALDKATIEASRKVMETQKMEQEKQFSKIYENDCERWNPTNYRDKKIGKIW